MVLRVTKILPAADRFYVEGTVRSALGFEDEEIMVKDYGNYLSWAIIRMVDIIKSTIYIIKLSL